MGVSEDTVHLPTGQMRLKDKYKDPDMLPKVNKANMAVIMKAIEEYLTLHHDIIRVPLTYIIRKTMIVQTYGDYPKYATPENEMIARMLHLPVEKKMLHNEKSAPSVTEHKTEYMRDNKSV